MNKNYRILRNFPAILLLQNRISTSLFHSQASTLSSLNPWFVTGFSDAEASFSLSISASSKYGSGYLVKLLFDIGLDERDRELLKKIQSYFEVGKIYEHGNSVIIYRVTSIKDLSLIIHHFNKYPLLSQKRADFELFKQALELIYRKEHLTTEGLEKLIAIKASMNNGLSDELKAAFPNIKPANRPGVDFKGIFDPN